MATRVSKITGVFLLLLINLATSCNKNKLVYYTPSNASKQSVALAEINKVDVVDLNSTPLNTVCQSLALAVPENTNIPVVVLKEALTPVGKVDVDLNWSPLVYV